MNLSLVFTLKLLSDFHLASGFGYGKSVDSALLRDENGIPVVRGSTIVGLMRSAGEELKNTLNINNELFLKVFGNKGIERNWACKSAKIRPKVETSATTQNRLFSGLKRSVRIDPVMRRAEEKKYFIREFGSGELEFEFEIVLTGLRGTEKDEASLLVASARLVRYLGGSIHRGAGQCRISLDRVEGITGDINQTGLLEHFRKLLRNEQREETFVYPKQQITTLMTVCQRYRIIARNLEPLLIAKDGQDGYEYESKPYVPGSTVYGAIAKQYFLKQGMIDSSTEDYNKFISLFRRDRLMFSPLYPGQVSSKGANITPAIPMPLDILTCKRHSVFARNKHTYSKIKGYATVEKIPESCRICEPLVSPMVSTEGFLPIRWMSDSVDKMKPNFVFEPHVVMRKDERRADDRQLFAYNALDAGQIFLGEIVARDEDAARQLLALCEPVPDNNQVIQCYTLTTQIGKGISRGYGKVQLLLYPADESVFNPLTIEKRVTGPKAISLLFLSDTIIYDLWGRSMALTDIEELTELLGVKVVRIIQSFAAVAEIDGFNAKAGLPKFRDTVIKAGSVIGFDIDDNTELKKLHEQLCLLEDQGIGYRRQEGFGKIAFNHSLYSMPAYAKETVGITNPFQDDSNKIMNLWREIVKDLTDNISPDFDLKFNRELTRWLYTQEHLKPEDLCNKIMNYGTFNILKNHKIPKREKQTEINKQINKVSTKITGDFIKMEEILKTKITEVTKIETEKTTLKNELWPLCLRWYGTQIMLAEQGGVK